MPHSDTIINFPGIESDEQIFIVARHYPLALLPTLVMIVVMTVLGGAAITLAGMGQIIPYNILIFTGSAFLLFMLLFTMVEFFDFYFDQYIVTDRRIVDISQQRLFSRSVAELPLEDVEDVNAKTSGYFGTIFDFGDVEIQTAGSKPNFNFSKILHPTQVAAMVIDLSSQARRGIAEAARHPQGPVAAIINGQLLPHTADHRDEVPVSPSPT